MKVEKLTKALLEQHPIWIWDDAMEFLRPVPSRERLEDYGTLFLRTVFTLNNGMEFEGCLIGGACYHAYEIIIDSNYYSVNFSLSPLYKKSLERLFKENSLTEDDFFPLKFRHKEDFPTVLPRQGVFESPF